MISKNKNTKISKFLSLVLRHKPQTIGIQLDENGWANVRELLQKARDNGVGFDLETLRYVVETNSKKRFAFDDSEENIRASQGHSINVELGYTNKKPPEILFHGTAQKSVHSILEQGLQKRNRQYVHLSADYETAINVGHRHGKPFVFKVMADKMYLKNHEFFLSANGVWLTDHVPVEYLEESK